jgi:hypothetical protein
MDELHFLSLTSSRARDVPVRPFATEAEFGQFIIRHAEAIAGVAVIAAEHRITSKSGGRIDAIGVDADNCPVILEFKKEAAGGAIGQGLYYLDLLVAHREIFTLIALEKLGQTRVERLHWSRARLLCIAQEISEREEAVARQIGEKVELLRVQRFANNLIAVQKAPIVAD